MNEFLFAVKMKGLLMPWNSSKVPITNQFLLHMPLEFNFDSVGHINDGLIVNRT